MPEDKKELPKSELLRQRAEARKCKNCGALPKDHVVRDYDPIWLDGKVYCTKCGAFVRDYDAG